MYYISKAPNGSAMVSTAPPKGKHFVAVDKLPEGDGMLMFDGKDRVYRVPFPAPVPTADERITELETINAELEDAMCEMDAANEERFAPIEDALCEMDALTEERLGAIEDALCEMDMG